MAIQPISWVVKETIQSERDSLFHRTDIVCGGIRAAIAVSIGADKSKQQAQLIADAVNNTANKGIDPNAVPGLLEALKEAKDLLHTLRVESLYRAHNQRKKQMDKIEQAIKSADLK